ncbi:IMPACT family protein [Nitratifractor salsuginis]|uniref:Uncharacterized protein family UPF0029, Impact, N-terminal protein n=1 Tax=Nitratifractor salsuginis (strain DSM 16511 / JCM 12458 / E9I37-1) TaxID=749222 RepID=E6WXU9_NITSE|nr:YigZ family protein [Nitratifractor salsuginis]ADV46356.1 Uncharacterized protein family UPF0029, Impact, N-terminal protein [Nitratifractor salsuginis DSM 16511]
MQTVSQSFFAETIVKRSKFLSYLVPIADFETLHSRLRKEHPKANHIVTAYRRFNEHRQIVEHSSDDGEPKGCAGVPTLNVLRGNDLVECAILTVRYFGGIKLGTGGMVRAYTQAASSVIDCANLKHWVMKERYHIGCAYSALNRLECLINELDIEVLHRDFPGYEVRLKLSADPGSYAMLLKKANGLLLKEMF